MTGIQLPAVLRNFLQLELGKDWKTAAQLSEKFSEYLYLDEISWISFDDGMTFHKSKKVRDNDCI